MVWNEDNKLRITISGSSIPEDMTNFPIMIVLSSGTGINNYDTTVVFDELTYSGTLGSSDDFTGTNGDPPDVNVWYQTSEESAEIQSNALRVYTPASGGGYGSYVRSRFNLVGDFDIQVDFSLDTHPSTDTWEMAILAISSSHRVYLTREYNTADRYRSLVYTDGVGYEDTTTQNQDDLTGKLRIVRTSGVVYTYYYDSGWQVLINGSTQTDITEEMQVQFYMWNGGSNPTAQGNFDNFTVTSGTVRNDQTRKKIALFSGGDQVTGDQCYVEIEDWDTINEVATLHAQVPTLSSGTEANLYLYYDIEQDDQDYRNTSDASDTFSGTNGDPPDPQKWLVTSGDPDIQSNKLHLTATGATERINSRFVLINDFDVKVNFDMTDHPDTESWGVFLMAQVKGNTPVIQIIREYNTDNRYRFDVYDGVSYDDQTTGTLDHTTGALRFVRLGTTVRGYYYTGGSWVQVGTDKTWNTSDVNISLRVRSYNTNPLVTTELSNFTVTSGTATGFVDDTGGYPAQEVWDSNFLAVYHMAQDPTDQDDVILDSTSNEYHLTASGTMTTTDLVDGQVGKALDLDGSDDYLTHLNLLDTVPAEGAILSLIRSDIDSHGSTDKRIVSKTNDGTGGSQDLIDIYWDANGTPGSRFLHSRKYNNGSAIFLDSTTEIGKDTWYFILTSWGSDGFKLQINDTVEDSDPDTNSFGDGNDRQFTFAALDLGGGTQTQHWDGKIDESYVLNFQPSNEWANTFYSNFSDELIYYEFVTAPAPPGGLPDAEGYVMVGDILTSGIVVRLYRRLDGSLVGEDITTVSGTFTIPTTYDEYHYALALYTTSGTNALIYDWLHPTLNP